MGDPHALKRRRQAAYRRANLLLSGAGLTLVLAGVPPRSPVIGAIQRALRVVNEAGGIEASRKEVTPDFPPQRRRYGRDSA
jgi:hypothetical protein